MRTIREWQPAIAPMVEFELAPPLPPLIVRPNQHVIRGSAKKPNPSLRILVA